MSKRAPADWGPFYFRRSRLGRLYSAEMDGDARELKALCDLPRSTCPVPHCRANARPTGMLVRFADRWYMEHRCPDCDEVYKVWFPELDALIALLDAAPATEHDAVTAAWVAGPQNPRFLRR